MASGNFKSLIRKHGVKICVSFPCSVESIGLAVGEKVGHSGVVSAARMNSAVVVFLDRGGEGELGRRDRDHREWLLRTGTAFVPTRYQGGPGPL